MATINISDDSLNVSSETAGSNRVAVPMVINISDEDFDGDMIIPTAV